MRRRGKTVSYNGETKTIWQWAKSVGMTYDLLRHRLDYGWPIGQALVRTRRPRRSTGPLNNPNCRTRIPLTRGEWAIIDEEDYERVAPFLWHLSGNPDYASTVVDGKHVRMHRFIINAPDGQDVDHINRNRLDNRRSNLRLASDSQNAANKALLIASNTSGFRGVTYSKAGRKWQAGIKVNGKCIHLGWYSVKEEAARAYDARAIQEWGEFARVNFPEEHGRVA